MMAPRADYSRAILIAGGVLGLLGLVVSSMPSTRGPGVALWVLGMALLWGQSLPSFVQRRHRDQEDPGSAGPEAGSAGLAPGSTGQIADAGVWLLTVVIVAALVVGSLAFLAVPGWTRWVGFAMGGLVAATVGWRHGQRWVEVSESTVTFYGNGLAPHPMAFLRNEILAVRWNRQAMLVLRNERQAVVPFFDEHATRRLAEMLAVPFRRSSSITRDREQRA